MHRVLILSLPLYCFCHNFFLYAVVFICNYLLFLSVSRKISNGLEWFGVFLASSAVTDSGSFFREWPCYFHVGQIAYSWNLSCLKRNTSSCSAMRSGCYPSPVTQMCSSAALCRHLYQIWTFEFLAQTSLLEPCNKPLKRKWFGLVLLEGMWVYCGKNIQLFKSTTDSCVKFLTFLKGREVVPRFTFVYVLRDSSWWSSGDWLYWVLRI